MHDDDARRRCTMHDDDARFRSDDGA